MTTAASVLEQSVALGVYNDGSNCAPPWRRPLCGCGTCGLPAPISKKTDRRSGSIAGQPQRFVRGHAVRLRWRLEMEMRAARGYEGSRPEEQHRNQRSRLRRLAFADITEDWFLAHVDTTGRHWFADATEVTIEGHRVHMARIGVLLWQHRPVTLEALANLRLGRRCCGRRCCRPDHARRSSRPSRAGALQAMLADLEQAG